MIFGPVFFANIGIGMRFDQMDIKVFLFGLVFVVFAILGKIIGCGVVAKATKFSFKDSLKVGVGMIARGEVALIVTSKGVDAGIIDQKYMTVVVMLVLVSSVLAPILLKLLFKNDKDDSSNGEIKEEVKSTNNEENNANNTLVLTTSEETATTT